MPKNIKQLFKSVKLLILDVDGVLTKGEIIFDSDGRELKVFNVKDGLGVTLLSKLGIKTILLSARNSPVLKKRASDMRVAEVLGGILPKEKVIGKIKNKYNVKIGEICFVGDDLIDLGLVKIAGVGVAVADAHLALKRSADYITKKKGGQGAVREVIDLIISAKGWNKKLLESVRGLKK